MIMKNTIKYFLVIDKKFMNDIEDYGTFYIFHNTNSKFNSILRNSCYTGYSLNKNLPSFVFQLKPF